MPLEHKTGPKQTTKIASETLLSGFEFIKYFQMNHHTASSVVSSGCQFTDVLAHEDSSLQAAGNLTHSGFNLYRGYLFSVSLTVS